MAKSETFRVRFRFRVQKKLNIKARKYKFKVGKHTVILSPQLSETEICDTEWLVMNARQFESKGEAQLFAEKLKLACEVSSVSARLGIDSGVDLPTSGFGKMVKDHVREQTGAILRDNIHGIDVFPDDPNIRIIHLDAKGTIRAAPDPFLADLSTIYEGIENVSQITRDIILLLNYALTRPEPVAQIVFAFSAVEMLGQTEDWSSEQRELLNELAISAKESNFGTEQEREEVALAIQKGTYKLSLRQGVLRLLASLNLDHLKPVWDELYGQRSTLVHGLAPEPGSDYGNLAFRVVSLCGQILVTAIAKEVGGANMHIEKFYTS